MVALESRGGRLYLLSSDEYLHAGNVGSFNQHLPDQRAGGHLGTAVGGWYLRRMPDCAGVDTLRGTRLSGS